MTVTMVERFGHGKRSNVMGIEFFELLSLTINSFSRSTVFTGKADTFFHTIGLRSHHLLINLPKNHLQVASSFPRLKFVTLEKQLENFSEHVIFPVSLDNERICPSKH